MNDSTTLTAYKLNKQFTSSIDIFDLLEAYYPEKHHTIVRMRNAAYRELIESGVLTADGISDSCPDLPYKNILNTCIPTNWFSCPPSKIITAVDKLRSQIDLLPPVYLIDEGVVSILRTKCGCAGFQFFYRVICNLSDFFDGSEALCLRMLVLFCIKRVGCRGCAEKQHIA